MKVGKADNNSKVIADYDKRPCVGKTVFCNQPMVVQPVAVIFPPFFRMFWDSDDFSIHFEYFLYNNVAGGCPRAHYYHKGFCAKKGYISTWCLAIRCTCPVYQGTGSIFLLTRGAKKSPPLTLDRPDFCRAITPPTTGNRINPVPRRRLLHYTAKPAPLPCADCSFCGGSAPTPPASSKEQNEQNPAFAMRACFVHQSRNGFVYFMILFIFLRREQNSINPLCVRVCGVSRVLFILCGLSL